MPSEPDEDVSMLCNILQNSPAFQSADDTSPDDHFFKPIFANLTSRLCPSEPLEEDDPEIVSYFFGAVICIIMVISIMGNSLVLIAIGKTKTLQRMNNVWYVSLAAADLARATLCMPGFAIMLMTPEWSLPAEICPFYHSLHLSLQTVSLFNLTAISIDRAFVISCPLVYQRVVTTRKMVICIVSLWVVSFLYGFLQILWWLNPSEPPEDSYGDLIKEELQSFNTECSFKPSLTFSIIDMIITTIIPLIIMIVAYAKIFRVVHNQMKRLKKRVSEVWEDESDTWSDQGGRTFTKFPPIIVTSPHESVSLHTGTVTTGITSSSDQTRTTGITSSSNQTRTTGLTSSSDQTRSSKISTLKTASKHSPKGKSEDTIETAIDQPTIEDREEEATQSVECSAIATVADNRYDCDSDDDPNHDIEQYMQHEIDIHTHQNDLPDSGCSHDNTEMNMNNNGNNQDNDANPVSSKPPKPPKPAASKPKDTIKVPHKKPNKSSVQSHSNLLPDEKYPKTTKKLEACENRCSDNTTDQLGVSSADISRTSSQRSSSRNRSFSLPHIQASALPILKPLSNAEGYNSCLKRSSFSSSRQLDKSIRSSFDTQPKRRPSVQFHLYNEEVEEPTKSTAEDSSNLTPKTSEPKTSAATCKITESKSQHSMQQSHNSRDKMVVSPSHRHTQVWASRHFNVDQNFSYTSGTPRPSVVDSMASGATWNTMLQRRRRSLQRFKENKAVKMTSAVIGAFVLCWLPYEVIFVVKQACGDCIPTVAWIAVNTLAYSASAINPFIYNFYSSEFRRAVRRVLCCKDNQVGPWMY